MGVRALLMANAEKRPNPCCPSPAEDTSGVATRSRNHLEAAHVLTSPLSSPCHPAWTFNAITAARGTADPFCLHTHLSGLAGTASSRGAQGCCFRRYSLDLMSAWNQGRKGVSWTEQPGWCLLLPQCAPSTQLSAHPTGALVAQPGTRRAPNTSQNC